MPSLRDLEVVHRLNAPTRAGATRRRRLRKTCACACVVAAAFIATGGTSHERSDGSPSPATTSQTDASRAELRGRHLVPVKADAALTGRLNATSRVDVWGPDGVRLASSAPVVPSTETRSRQMDAGVGADEGTILIALSPADVKNIAQHRNAGRVSWSDLFVTVQP